MIPNQEYYKELKGQSLETLPPVFSWAFTGGAVFAASSLKVPDMTPGWDTSPGLGQGPVMQTVVSGLGVFNPWNNFFV